MIDSGVPWIGEIPKEWKLLRNKNAFLCSKEIVGDKSATTQLLSLTTKGVKEKGQDVVGGKVPESYDTYQTVRKGQLVMCLFDLDCSAVFSGLSPFDGMISPAYKVLDCKAGMDSSFASYWFSSVFDGRKFMHYSKNLRYTLTYDEFSVLPMVIPQLQEQRRIADFLDTKCAEINTIMEKTRASIEDYKKLKQSVITEVVTKGIRGNRPMKESGYEWIGEIPADWSLPKLGWITSKIGSGYTPKGGAEVYVNEGIKFLRSQNVYFEGFSLDDVAYITPEVDEEMSGTRVRKGDILFNITGGSIGRCRFVDENLGPANVNQHVCIVRPTKISTKYLFYFLQSDAGQTQVDVLQTGGNREGLSASAFKQFSVPLPDEFEQQEIAAYLDEKCAAIDSLIASKEALITELEAYKKSIIYEYVTGKKEVPAV